MKKKQSKKPAIPSDPIIKIYNHVFYLLQYLRSLAASKLNPPTEYERTVEGDLTWTKPSVERCWQEFDCYMKMYFDTYKAFTPILVEIRELRRDPIVCDMIFRTFEGKERESAHLDEAIDFIERGFHLFRRLIEEGGYVEERTEKVFYRQAAVCSRIWRDHDYTPSEITTLEAGLKWESAWIHNRRNPLQATLLSVPESSSSNKKKGIGGRSSRDSITERSNRELLIAILLEHHRFNHPKKNLNLAPISTEEAVAQLGKSEATLSRTWKRIRKGLDYDKYCRLCGQYSTLESFLRMIDSKEGYLERSNNQEAIDYSEE